MAYEEAKEDVNETFAAPVPLHIRNAPTKLMKDIGYGADYQYDHEHDNKYYYQKYFPDNMKEDVYYTPGEYGFEKEIQKRLNWWDGLKKKQG